MTLKPFTERIVCVTWPKAYRGADAVILESMVRSKNQQNWTARVVVRPTGRTTVYKACNPTPDTIALKPMVHLTTMEKININAISVMEGVPEAMSRS